MIETSLQSEPVAMPERPSGPSAGRTVATYSVMTALMSVVLPGLVLLPAALLHCGVRYGRRIAWLAMGLGTIGAVLITLQWGARDMHTELAYLAAAILAFGPPALAVLPMVERGEPFGRVLLYALVCSFAGLCLAEAGSRTLLHVSPYADQVASTREAAASVAQNYVQRNLMPAANAKMFANLSVLCVTGSLMILIATAFAISLVVFGRLRAWRELLEKREIVLAAPYLFRNLAFPDWLLFAFILGGLSPLLKGVAQHVGANVLTVVIFLYLMQGLAIFRAFLVAMGASLGMTVFAWGMLVLLTFAGGISPLLLGLAGLFDPFFDFRHFTKKRKDDSDESHSD